MFAVVIVIVIVPGARAKNLNVQAIGATHRPIPMIGDGDRSWMCGIVDNMCWVARPQHGPSGQYGPDTSGRQDRRPIECAIVGGVDLNIT